jgi:hypothetical protein
MHFYVLCFIGDIFEKNLNYLLIFA